MENLIPKTTKVLLVDDDEDDYIIIRRTFDKIPDSPFELDWTNSFEDAKKLITSQKYDLYLIDYRLGKHSGLDLLKLAEPDKRVEPFIILTGAGDERIQKKAIQLSASEYLVKGEFGSELLSRTLKYAIGRKEIDQQKLEHLVELNRAKDEFISIASHQLRTPATGVKQYLGMLMEGMVGDLSADQIKIITKAYKNNERQLRIVADLLKVAQVDAGKMTLHISEVDVTSAIKDILSDLGDVFRARDQIVEFDSKTTHMAYIDYDAIRMVLENIIDNASKYSPEHTKIQIFFTEKKDSVTVHVNDQGVGVEEKDQSRLFEKFSRIDNPLSTKVGGSGLGLYLAKQLVDLHGGTITYKPNPEGASEFLISLPKENGIDSINQDA